MKTTLATLLLIFLCAPGLAQTKGKPATTNTGNEAGSTSPANIKLAPKLPPGSASPIGVTTLVPSGSTIGGYPVYRATGSTQITWSDSNSEPDSLHLTYTAIWLGISRNEIKIGWLIPACTTANLKRAPKLTAWVVGMNAYSSPQARWLSALFKNCEIQ